jgi:hypothetical protein
MIAALGDQARTGGDPVDAHPEGGAFFVTAFEAHVGFVDQQARLPGQDSVFVECVQFIGGSQVMVLPSEFHIAVGG